jgi:hypothetical protein
MTEKIEETTRAQVLLFLPAAIERATSSYHEFMKQETALTPKDFSDHHKAGKVAISHFELLLKLARWADIPSGEESGIPDGLTALLSNVESNVEKHKKQFSESQKDEDDLA